jgi:carbohydrate binding protein with CBM4/9 domain
MTRKQFVIIALAGCALAVAGCKKEEQAKEGASAPVQQATTPAVQTGLTAYDFESGIAGWAPNGKTVKIEQVADQKHGGNGSLKVSGSSGVSSWNFAASPKFTLESGKKYRLSGWMMVESTSDPKNAPFLKCSLKDGAKFLTNANTKKYNLNKLNEWQELSTEFTAPAGQKLEGAFAIEKGTNKVDINATIYVDDLKLEAI